MNPYPFTPLLPKLPIPCALIGNDRVIKLISDQGVLLGFHQGQVIEVEWLEHFLEGDKDSDRIEIAWNDSYWQIDLNRVADGVVFVATDITQLINQSLQKDKFSRKVLKHETPTKITAVQFYANKARQSWEIMDFEKARENYDKAMRSLQGLEDLLEQSSYLYGANKTPKRSQVFRHLVEQAVTELTPKIEAIGAQVEIIGNGTKVFCDRVRLLQAVINLISNALKYHPKNKDHRAFIRVEILEVIDRGRKYAYLEVSDNGIGIEEKHQGKIFEPLNRLHSGEDYTGAGLGLAIVNQVVNEHGGSAGVVSHIGEGALFWLKIPTYETDPAGGR